ncbi:expressed unknown protein [Seminavis robusta]|uniref:Uncharacterized protein n=1 Tax=Seminavis robusta TaxID=568900 RepID=A0A9N8EBZ6_9STRA|nr:expressed unknown protein [Seminavis robusta]|eukprot:Sro901_g218070.1 n/a (314) ;mRNA; r:34322-35263
MASIANNLNNPHFDQVVIILDSATELSNCDHFRSKMKQFQRRFRRWSDDNQIHDVLLPKNKNKPILTCIDRPEGQPSYFDMFRYASNPDIVTSEVVIMGNADQAFDDSVSWASLIKNRTLLTLPTQGYQQDRAPPRVQAFFQFASTQGVSKRKSKTESGTVNIPNRCAKATTLSWDSYVFPRALLEEKISETAFQRGVLTGPNGEPNGMAYFPMNMQGAEDAALWAVTKKLRNIQVAYGCDIIKTWHFHAARKMHLSGGKQIHWDWQHPITISGKAHTRVEFNNTLLVPTPWRKPRDELDDAFVIQPAEFMQQ